MRKRYRGELKEIRDTEIVAFIYNNPHMTQAEVAEYFGYAQNTISDIFRPYRNIKKMKLVEVTES